ncbi:MAG TPA: sigma-70 family RNA polymerase sigma factor [Acidimicrobiia bacterium]|nr:sigma-70 family RNA polymerase sigma factor [Acidimicrobiia bacterium]
MNRIRRADDGVVLDALGQYMDGLDLARLLTAEEEVELAQAMEEGAEARARLEAGVGDEAERTRLESVVTRGDRARDRFIEANLRLVVSNARRYANSDIEMLDLIQEGNLGLITAVERFDWRRGFKFSTYATWWIRQAMQRARATLGVIRIPSGVYEVLPAVRSATDQLRVELGRSPTADELAEHTGLSVNDVERALAVAGTVSIDMPVGEDGASLGEFLPDDRAEDPELAAEAVTLTEAVGAALAALPATHRTVVGLRFGIDSGAPATLAQITDATGLSQRQVGAILRECVDTLREQLQAVEDLRVA